MSRSASPRTHIDAVTAIDAWIESGRIVDLILAMLALEAIGLAWWRRARGGLLPFLPGLAAGACLLLALRAATTAAAWPWIAVALLGALVAHLLDLGVRLRR